MWKYFGTDGIRGRANEKLTPEIAYRVGRYLGYHLAVDGGEKFLIGRDPRQSGQMLEAALVSGLTASGCHVDLVGVVTTPVVSYLLEHLDYVGGIMITASHNPYHDNGLKIMDNKGFKIDPFLMSEIEDYIDQKIEIPYRIDDKIGKVSDRQDLKTIYIEYLKKEFDQDLSQFKIAVDAANGGASDLVSLFQEFKLDVKIINNKPNGININDQCGSTHIKNLQDFMKDQDFDLGVSFDGDGDRLMLVDEFGSVVDGDGILYIISNYYKKYNELKNNKIVVTVMSNIGLHKALEAQDIDVIVCDVGDINVLENMKANDLVIGGEQSGHIILSKHSNMGDGFLVALKILSIMAKENKKLSQLVEDLNIYPQLLENVKVKNIKELLEDSQVIETIEKVRKKLAKEGRVLVRPSGTEPLIRVMVEAKTDQLTQAMVSEITAVIKTKI